MRIGGRVLALIMLPLCFLGGCAVKEETRSPYAPEETNRLTIYTSHKPNVYEPIIREFEDRTGIWVSVETGGTNELLERIAGESQNPVCDVMFGGGVENLESSSAYFTPYAGPEAESVLPVYASENHVWTPFSSLPIVLIYNTKLTTPDVFNGWNDLMDEAWRGKIAYADPAVSGSSYTALCTLCQIIGGDPQSVMARFARQLDGRQLGDSGQVASAVADGTFLVGITLEETALKRIAAGDDIAMLYPPEGTSAVPDGSALVKGAPHEDNAKLFLDFVLGKDVQNQIVHQLSRRSVRADIALSSTLAANTRLRLIDYDLTWASESHAQNLELWSRAAGGKETP